MPLYTATISGHKPVLISGKSAKIALESFVSLKAMKTEEVIAAMESGQRAFKPGDKIVAVEPDTQTGGNGSDTLAGAAGDDKNKAPDASAAPQAKGKGDSAS